jgi:hypothetical protein
MTSTSEALEEALKSAAAGDSESETVADESNEETEVQETKTESKSDEEGAKKTPQTVPYERVQKLSGKVSDLSQELESIQGKLQERDGEIAKLVDLLEIRENDSRVIQKINELHSDPRYTEMVEKMDAAIRGVDVALEETEEAKEKAKESGDEKGLLEISKVARELQETKSNLEAQLADEVAERLLDQAGRISDGLFAELDETYNADDRRVLEKAIIDNVDWEAIEENPESLPDVLVAGFKDTLEWYGEPRGALASSKGSEETETTTTKASSEPTLEDLKKVDWGKMKTVEDSKGNKTVVPAIDDATYSEALSRALRIARES